LSLIKRLKTLSPEVLRSLRRGIEKESLRVTPDGMLASTPHPAALGAALTHPHITTDFSESQLELVTGVHLDVQGCLDDLSEIHQFVHRNIGDELLWCASMPCRLPEDRDIPIGRYGTSNVGRAKTVYRTGLSHRYGSRMQTISGIHYNFSLPGQAWPLLQQSAGFSGPVQTFQDAAYFSLIRSFRRHSWLLLYLFGASPAVCNTFVAGREHGLQQLVSGVLYLPWATSLRMSPLGYQSAAQGSLAVSYNNLETYAHSLSAALTVPYPDYEKIGIRDGDTYRQLGTTLLQIENEFYGTIRPKRPIRPGERPLHALRERGVEYVEVRLMDLDPFCPIGITAATVRFLDIFLLHCLLSDAPADTPAEIGVLARNQLLVARRGRDPDLRLTRGNHSLSPAEWGTGLMRELEPIADALDAAHRSSAYRDALAAAASGFTTASITPSARVLEEMAQRYGNSFPRFALTRSQLYKKALLDQPLAPDNLARFERMAAESLEEQRRIEASDTMPFENYRQLYLSHDRLRAKRVNGTTLNAWTDSDVDRRKKQRVQT
jgi:glutamate--cysteine ligase